MRTLSDPSECILGSVIRQLTEERLCIALMIGHGLQERAQMLTEWHRRLVIDKLDRRRSKRLQDHIQKAEPARAVFQPANLQGGELLG